MNPSSTAPSGQLARSAVANRASLLTPFRRRMRGLMAVMLVPALLAPAAAAQAELWWETAQRKARGSLVDLLEDDGRFGTLLAALDAAELTEAVETGSLTVFAPTDEAFAALGQETIDALLEDKPTLTDILLYHVVGEPLRTRKLVRRSTVETLQGQDVVVVHEKGTVRINGIRAIDTNLRARNGIAHVIEEVLLPPDGEEPIENLVDVLERDGRFGTLLAALDATGLTETLENGGPFTVFAPTDEAFADLGQDTIDALLDDPDTLREILLFHVLGEEKRAAKLVIAGTAETLQGDSVGIRLENFRRIVVEDAPVLTVNVKAPNGIAHILDAVLLPPPPADNVLDRLSDEGYTTLVAAIEAAGLAEALASLGPVTIFAPTNEAFAALGQETIDALLADPPALQEILLYHVAAEEKRLIDVIVERELTTLQGKSVRSFWFFGPVFVGGQKVIDPNVSAPDAIVHGIDGVLIPPSH